MENPTLLSYLSNSKFKFYYLEKPHGWQYLAIFIFIEKSLQFEQEITIYNFGNCFKERQDSLGSLLKSLLYTILILYNN